VVDKESGLDPFTEHTPVLNPGLKRRDIRKAFEGGEYQVLLVANKFQTGFDQPLLCGMYVDKRLAGIQAVQTLSRLNRAHPGKDTTYVLDFANEPADVLEAFKTYHTTATLSATTDPNLVYDLRAAAGPPRDPSPRRGRASSSSGTPRRTATSPRAPSTSRTQAMRGGVARTRTTTSARRSS
jgi:hypothetical protein